MTDSPVPNEPQLISAAAAGDGDAFDQLMLAYYSQLSVYITPRLRSSGGVGLEVDDILQETFKHAFRDIQNYQARPNRPFVAWLKAIAENRILDTAKGLNRKKRGGDRKRVEKVQNLENSLVDLVFILSDADSDTPSQTVAKEEAAKAMREAIEALPDDQEQAVRLHYLEHLSVEKTAETMQRTPAAVRGLLHRAKQVLKASLIKSSLWFSKKQ